MLRFLTQIDESFRAPLVLFFLEELSYKQIAQVLEIPLGTVQSRIARAKAHLYQLLTHAARKDPDWRITQTVASRSSILSRNDQSNPDRRFQSPVEQKRPSLSGRRKRNTGRRASTIRKISSTISAVVAAPKTSVTTSATGEFRYSAIPLGPKIQTVPEEQSVDQRTAWFY